MVNIQQHIPLTFGCGNQLNPQQRLLAHDVEGTTEIVMCIMLKIVLRHLTVHDIQFLRLVDKLAGFPVLVNQEANLQFLSLGKDCLHGFFQTMEVNTVSKLCDTRTVVLHDFRELQAVVEYTEL